ncbi:MAG: tetratricopeptide repeat protein [Taibaiella sp.]|jgi:signal transduction histidine kinase
MLQIFGKIIFAASFIWFVMATSFAQEGRVFVRWDTTSINELLQQAKKITLSGKTDSARQLYILVQEQSQYLRYDYGFIKGEIGLGNIAINSGEYNEALDYYTSAIKKCNSKKAKMLLTTLHNNIGNIYTLKGNYEKSTEQYELALTCAERYGSELALETIYNNLSIALNKLNRPQRSLFYLEKAEKLALENNNYYTLADIYNNKGSAYVELKNAERSAAFFNDAILISRKYGYQNTLYSALVNLGIHYLNENRIKEAISKFEEADKIDANINSYYRNLKTLASGAAYLKDGNLAKAKPLLFESLDQAIALGNLRDQVTTHTLLAELYRIQGDFKKAFEHKSTELLLFDSLKKKETSYMVTEMEAKYNTTLKDKELSKKHLTISRQSAALAKKNQWIAGGVICLVIIIVLALLQGRNFRHKQKLKNEQLKLLEQQQKNIEMKLILDGAEKERIRLSREIHDSIMVQFSVVKMNLSIYAGINPQQLTPEKLVPIVKQLDDATDNLRRTAHNLMPDRLIEDGLVEAVFYFCNNLQKSVPISISFQPIGTMPPLPTPFELSLYRVIQELMQNIIKHAEATEAIVQLSCEHDLLSITVEDNGKGINEDHEDVGLGLKSIEARVNEFSGRFTIDTTPNVGTTVHLEFSVAAINRMPGVNTNKIYS